MTSDPRETSQRRAQYDQITVRLLHDAHVANGDAHRAAARAHRTVASVWERRADAAAVAHHLEAAEGEDAMAATEDEIAASYLRFLPERPRG